MMNLSPRTELATKEMQEAQLKEAAEVMKKYPKVFTKRVAEIVKEVLPLVPEEVAYETLTKVWIALKLKYTNDKRNKKRYVMGIYNKYLPNEENPDEIDNLILNSFKKYQSILEDLPYEDDDFETVVDAITVLYEDNGYTLDFIL